MRVMTESEVRLFCDHCGKEDDSDFVLSMDYGGEDSCFLCHDDERQLEGELSHFENHKEDLIFYLSQEDYHSCQDCRCDDFNFMSEFEKKARSSRVELIRKLVKEKILPEFADASLYVQEERKKCREQVQTSLAKLKEGKLTPSEIISEARELIEAYDKSSGDYFF